LIFKLGPQNEIFSFRADGPASHVNMPVSGTQNNQTSLELEHENSVNPSNENLLEEEVDDDLEDVSILLFKITKTHINFQIFFIFIMVYFIFNISFITMIHLTWVNDMLNLNFYIPKMKRSKR
jgi:hypothetical protein